VPPETSGEEEDKFTIVIVTVTEKKNAITSTKQTQSQLHKRYAKIKQQFNLSGS